MAHALSLSSTRQHSILRPTIPTTCRRPAATKNGNGGHCTGAALQLSKSPSNVSLIECMVNLSKWAGKSHHVTIYLTYRAASPCIGAVSVRSLPGQLSITAPLARVVRLLSFEPTRLSSCQLDRGNVGGYVNSAREFCEHHTSCSEETAATMAVVRYDAKTLLSFGTRVAAYNIRFLAARIKPALCTTAPQPSIVTLGRRDSESSATVCRMQILRQLPTRLAEARRPMMIPMSRGPGFPWEEIQVGEQAYHTTADASQPKRQVSLPKGRQLMPLHLVLYRANSL